MSFNEEESRRYDSLSNYKTDLVFSSLTAELPSINQDSVVMLNRQRWHESLSKDIYMEEALNVLKDLMITQNENNTSISRE